MHEVTQVRVKAEGVEDPEDEAGGTKEAGGGGGAGGVDKGGGVDEVVDVD